MPWPQPVTAPTERDQGAESDLHPRRSPSPDGQSELAPTDGAWLETQMPTATQETSNLDQFDPGHSHARNQAGGEWSTKRQGRDLIHLPGIGTRLETGKAGHALFAVSPRFL